MGGHHGHTGATVRSVLRGAPRRRRTRTRPVHPLQGGSDCLPRRDRVEHAVAATRGGAMSPKARWVQGVPANCGQTDRPASTAQPLPLNNSCPLALTPCRTRRARVTPAELRRAVLTWDGRRISHRHLNQLNDSTPAPRIRHPAVSAPARPRRPRQGTVLPCATVSPSGTPSGQDRGRNGAGGQGWCRGGRAGAGSPRQTRRNAR
jgi:hypothetical protein